MSDCPATLIVLNALPRLTLISPLPRSVTLKPVSLSNLIAVTFDTELVIELAALISDTVNADPPPEIVILPDRNTD